MRGKGRRRYPRVARPRSLTPVASTSRGLPLRPSGRDAVVFVARAGMDAMSSMNRPPDHGDVVRSPRRRGPRSGSWVTRARPSDGGGGGGCACLWACRTDLGSDGVAGLRRSWRQGVPPPCRVAVVDLARSASSEALRTSMDLPPPARPCLPREGGSGRHPASAAMDQGRRSRCSKNGKPKRATGVGHRQRWRTQRTLVWSNALKSSGPWKQDAPRNGRRATVRGDVDAAVRVGKALKGVASEGKHDDVRQSALARHAAETR